LDAAQKRWNGLVQDDIFEDPMRMRPRHDQQRGRDEPLADVHAAEVGEVDLRFCSGRMLKPLEHFRLVRAQQAHPPFYQVITTTGKRRLSLQLAVDAPRRSASRRELYDALLECIKFRAAGLVLRPLSTAIDLGDESAEWS
jgi:hypothetical protein